MKAIILSRRDFREFDQTISLYTKEGGKLEVLARGVKKIISKNSAHLEPFSLIEVVIEPGKEINHLTKVQSLNYYSAIRSKVAKSLSAGYLVALTDRLTQVGEKDERIFLLLQSWLQFVDSIQEFNPTLVDGYIVKLLYFLGFSPELSRCVVCDVTVIARSLSLPKGTSQSPGFSHATSTLGSPRPDFVGTRDDRIGLYPAGGGAVCGTCRSQKEKIGEQVLACGREQTKDLQLLLEGNWQIIDNLKFEAGESAQLSSLIYEYTVFHSEKKIPDWRDLTTLG